MSINVNSTTGGSGNWSDLSPWRDHIGKSSSEPPSPFLRQSIVFLVGRNSRGKWVVRDQRGRCGGLFVNRNEALKFARLENGNRLEAVIIVPGTLELDLAPHATTTRHEPGDGPAQQVR